MKVIFKGDHKHSDYIKYAVDYFNEHNSSELKWKSAYSSGVFTVSYDGKKVVYCVYMSKSGLIIRAVYEDD